MPIPMVMVTIDEAAEILGISKRSVWRMVQRGSLPTLRSPEVKNTLIPESALTFYALARTRT